MRAAVCSGAGAGLVVEDLTLAGPGPAEVLVRIDAAGICHSDYHYLTGDLACPLPVVPGHEGAGVVEEVGERVSRVRPGDRVCLMWRPRCGHCGFCLTGRSSLCQAGAIHATSGGLLDGTSRLRRADGQQVHHLLGVSCFAEYAVVSEQAVVPIPADVPPEVAAVAGCAVITGVGAVLNVVGRCAGQAVAVFGAGGVGLSAVMGAVLSGAHPIVVVDVVAERLDAARRLGATHLIDARTGDVAGAVEASSPGGVDWAVEAIGRPETLGQAFDAVRPGGTLVAVGLAAHDQLLRVPVNALVQREKRIVGSLYGSSNPLLDVPRLLELYRAGRLPIDRLIGKRYPLESINDAFADLIGGGAGRGIVLPGSRP
ncbi:alcohol dehydrogenase catalytic domain-containing protein [Rugosimonospora africana]|uniref:Alcohol dehydrogenase n=1 Tax=Rugosimonospora africana TaxID=556532 RepID=A0A8J3QSJ4_9ACTN|nr:Zn-dependent alcohol dehydrogenase [Rugosimonospora africana]GIH15452.1 alcohol dehydrogenase [Rugosimonospora africana]